MATGHKNIVDAQRHECKGATAATVGQTIIATGSGTAAFGYANPRGSSYFVNLAAPYTLAYPAVYTKLAPTTTSTALNIEYTVSVDGRLTYTGTRTLATRAIVNVSLDQAIGANRDIELALYKNGVVVPSSVIANTTQSGLKVLTTIVVDISMATNDYLEVYAKNAGASGDIRIYSYYFTTLGMQ